MGLQCPSVPDDSPPRHIPYLYAVLPTPAPFHLFSPLAVAVDAADGEEGFRSSSPALNGASGWIGASPPAAGRRLWRGRSDTYSMEISEGTRKRTRASDGDGSGGSSAGCPDRLSALPDCLLHVIMSSLKARQVVQTCVLSTRWRHLWRSVPCLDVDIVEFRTKVAVHASDDDSTDPESDKGKVWAEFEDFTVNLLLRCNIALLDSFRLDIDRGSRPQSQYFGCSSAIHGWEYSGRQAAAWLRRAMKYSTPGSGRAIGPQRQGLNLSPISWRLKRLHLCHVPLDNCFVEHLSSVCRSLEDLELDHCTCEIRSIASGSLKYLVLRRCTWRGFLFNIASPALKTLVVDGGSTAFCCTLAISAPMVAYLCLDVDADHFHGGISINKMTSLDRASIHLRRHKDSFSKSIVESNLRGDQSKLLCSLSNVTSLELSDVGTTVLDEDPTFLEFQNLRNLLLDDCDLSDDFRILRFFHQGSPNLEKVTLWHCKFPGDSEDKEGTCKLDKTSSSGCCCSLDFLRDEKVELQIIHKDGDACRSTDELVRDPPNLKGATDAVPDTATAAGTEDSMPHSIGVGPRRGARHRMTSVRISGPEWERSM